MSDKVTHYHVFSLSQFPADFQKLCAKRAELVADLATINEAIDKYIGRFAGKIRVPVMVDTGRKSKNGKPIYKPAEDGSKVVLPHDGESLAISFKWVDEGQLKLYSAAKEAKAKSAKVENEILA